MKWDEDRFGLEYDLDIYNIVAVKARERRLKRLFLGAKQCIGCIAGLQHGSDGEQELERFQYFLDLGA